MVLPVTFPVRLPINNCECVSNHLAPEFPRVKLISVPGMIPDELITAISLAPSTPGPDLIRNNMLAEGFSAPS